MSAPLRIAIVAGEESGDLLGADVVAALKHLTGREVELVGVGGRHLQAMGLSSLFDGSEIALMGVTAVLRDLPRLIRRIGETARAVVQAKPDCLITIDSPDFSLRVAKKVRAANASIPIVHYVCPSVWAWRPGRAPAMKPYVDHILCVLPFEPDALKQLDGPKGTYVGHRLTAHGGVASAASNQASKQATRAISRNNVTRKLVVLPGSRRSEVMRLMKPFGEVIDTLVRRGTKLELVLPTVPHVAPLVEEAVAAWPIRPTIIHDEPGKWRAFGEADAALAASGTVLLELALSGVPHVSCYKTDRLIGPLMRKLVTVWSAALPNLIADWPVVTEYYDELVRPDHIARMLERLMDDTPLRDSQRTGFAQIADKMRTLRPPGELAARAILDTIETHR
jgi:lipid-A-disaccharide synthase